MADSVRLGIIGLGVQGGTYAKFLAEGRVSGMTLGAIADIDPQKKQDAEEFGVPFFSGYQELLDSGSVDAIITTVPHYLHAEIAMAALSRDIHALVEKPAGVYVRQVQELIEFAAVRPKLSFGIMFNQRTNPLYVRLKEIIDAGEIGDILRTNWIITTWWRPQAYYDQSEWRATWGGEGGGVLVNQAPHQLDLWQWLCGIPQTVFAKAAFGYRRDIAVEDEVTALVDYGNGATGVLVTATHDLVGTDRLEILGTAGKIVVDKSKTATVTRLAKPEIEISRELDMQAVGKIMREAGDDGNELFTTETLEFDTKWGGQHISVLENFAANILDGTPLLAPGADGINGVRLANAIHLSSWTGREVPLHFDDEEYLAELNKRIRDEGKFPERS
jgi:predicted dehydrogenase